MNGHKTPHDSHNYHAENHDEIELYQGISNRSTLWQTTPEQPTRKKQFYRLWWVLLTNVQCHMVPISILRYKEYWTIQLKVHLKPDRKQ